MLAAFAEMVRVRVPLRVEVGNAGAPSARAGTSFFWIPAGDVGVDVFLNSDEDAIERSKYRNIEPGSAPRRWQVLAGFRSPGFVTWGGAVDSAWASSFGLSRRNAQPRHTDAWRLPGANLQLETDRPRWNAAVIIPIQ